MDRKKGAFPTDRHRPSEDAYWQRKSNNNSFAELKAYL